MEIKTSSRCWGCGNLLSECICGNEQIEMRINAPLEPMPLCNTQPDFEELKNLSDKKIERAPIPRTCCVCNYSWKSTVENYQEWEAETCPKCGAT